MVGPKLVLWEQIHSFAIDDLNAKLTFTARLAQENGWSMPFAQRVVVEYRRFVFLAMVADHEVTPSDEVDQAWHLHLIYTRSYWDELCGNVLGRPLHHGPTRRERAESDRYNANYERTLTSYRSWFNESPPADIWPPAEIRFGAGTRHVRVNTAHNWILSKRALARAAATIGLVGLGLAGLGAAGPLAARAPIEPIVLVIAALVILAVIALARITRQKDRQSGDGSGGCGFWGGGCGSSGCGDNGGDGGSGCGGGGCGGGGCGGGD